MPEPKSKPVFFATPAKFRAWLNKNHAKADEIWVGFYKVSSGKKSMTWKECVDQALCYGWIDGIRKSIDGESYMNRLTPRRPGSNWSAVNIKRVTELTELGQMKPAGLKAFEARDLRKTNMYSFEQGDARGGLSPELAKEFKQNKKAWEFFEAQPPGYRKTSSFWVMSAKRAETRQRRLAKLIADSAKAKRLDLLSPSS
jgi:uncharacterized protein YdeI (YjbR/CyaY-like superfamily)